MSGEKIITVAEIPDGSFIHPGEYMSGESAVKEVSQEDLLREIAGRAIAMADPRKIEDYGKSIKASEMAGIARALLAVLDVRPNPGPPAVAQGAFRIRQISAACKAIDPASAETVIEGLDEGVARNMGDTLDARFFREV